MQHLDVLKKRVSTTLFITGAEIQKIRWDHMAENVPPEHESINNTTVCLIMIDDGNTFVGSNRVSDSREDGRDGAFDDALGNAYAYYEAMTSYPDTTTAPLNFETQDGCPND